MAYAVKIAGNDRSSWIEWPSLQWEEGLTKEPDMLLFSIKEQSDRTIPALGTAVEFWLDGVKKFAGTITERTQKNLGGLLLAYDFVCKDKQYDLDKYLVAKHYESMTGNEIIADIFDTFTDGTFTENNVEAGLKEITSIKFNYEPVSACLQRLADILGKDWYIDADKDLHFFTAASTSAPFDVDDTAGKLNFESLHFDRNILELKNNVIIAGGDFKDALDATETPDVYKADGTERTFKLIYRYDNVVVTKNGTPLTVGTDHLHKDTDYDVLYNFQEKAIKFRENNKPAANDIIKIYGDAYIPLLAQVIDSDSVAAYGERQSLYKNEKITSVSEAHNVGRQKLTDWADGSYEGQFTTREAGLRPGQTIYINSTKHGISKRFKIMRVSAYAISPSTLEYVVDFLSSGNVNFTDVMVGLLRNSTEFDLTDDTVIRRLALIREILETADAVSASKTSPPYKWASSDNNLVWGFGTWN